MENYDHLLISLLGHRANPEAMQLFEMLPIGIELYNDKGILVAVNKYDMQLFGFHNKAMLMGLNLFYDESVSPEFQERLGEEDEITLWHYYNFDRSHGSSKSGKMRVYTRFKRLRDEQDKVVGYVVLNMEDQTLSSSGDDPIVPAALKTYGSMKIHTKHNADNKVEEIIVTHMTPEIESMLGRSEKQLLNNNLMEQPIYLPHQDQIAALCDDNRKFTFYYYAVLTRKYLKWTVVYSGPDEYYCRLADITDHLMDNQALNFSETLFRSIFDKSPTAALFLSPMGRIEDANERFLDLTHLRSKEAIIGYRISRDSVVSEELRLSIQNSETHLFKQKFQLDTNIFKDANPEPLYLRIYSQKFYLSSGALRGYILYLTNITDEKNLEETLNDQKEEAIKASNMKSRFLQNMSHDIRTPLNAIVGFSQLLSLPDGTLTQEEKDEYAGHVSNNSNMLMMLVDDILNISDVENGNYRITPRPVRCNELCENTLKSIEYRVPGKVNCYYTSDVDDTVSINTDGRRVQQVLINFLTNACKHTTEGEIHLICKVKEIPGKIHFSVIDTGEGIDPSLTGNLFERFSKLNTVEGTGLGLNICRTIAEKLGGEVSHDPSYTNGAKFDFIIPETLQIL